MIINIVYRYLCQHSHFWYLHHFLQNNFKGLQNVLLPWFNLNQLLFRWISWVPIHFWRYITRPVSYYAFFKGWLLPSLPPGCLNCSTSFLTEKSFKDLSVRSGLFPSRPWTLAPKVWLPKSIVRIRSFFVVGRGNAPPSTTSALPQTFLRLRRYT